MLNSLVLKTANHWLNLTAGAMLVYKFGSPHKVLWLFNVSVPQSCGKLAKTCTATLRAAVNRGAEYLKRLALAR